MTDAPRTTADRHAAGLARALAHVDAHLAGRLDADTLARRAAMSRHHFHRVFAAHVGCSVGDYVASRRLRRACALLVSGDEPVLEIALAVGYESAQALAKAMRRELDASPTDVRRGDARAWARLLDHAPRPPSPTPGVPMIDPVRFTSVPDGHAALTATARGMVDRTLTRAARLAFGELFPAVANTGLLPRARTWLALCPDDANAPDDPDCRYVAAVLFDRPPEDTPAREPPHVVLSGSLAWWPIDPGPAAVFLHRGPYDRLHATWRSIYADWVPRAGAVLRDAPPFEVMLNDPERTPPAELLTEIWIPLVARPTP